MNSTVHYRYNYPNVISSGNATKVSLYMYITNFGLRLSKEISDKNLRTEWKLFLDAYKTCAL